LKADCSKTSVEVFEYISGHFGATGQLPPDSSISWLAYLPQLGLEVEPELEVFIRVFQSKWIYQSQMHELVVDQSHRLHHT